MRTTFDIYLETCLDQTEIARLKDLFEEPQFFNRYDDLDQKVRDKEGTYVFDLVFALILNKNIKRLFKFTNNQIPCDDVLRGMLKKSLDKLTEIDFDGAYFSIESDEKEI